MLELVCRFSHLSDEGCRIDSDPRHDLVFVKLPARRARPIRLACRRSLKRPRRVALRTSSTAKTAVFIPSYRVLKGIDSIHVRHEHSTYTRTRAFGSPSHERINTRIFRFPYRLLYRHPRRLHRPYRNFCLTSAPTSSVFLGYCAATPTSSPTHHAASAFQPNDAHIFLLTPGPFALLQSPNRELQSRRSQQRLHFCIPQSGTRPVGAESAPDTYRLLTSRADLLQTPVSLASPLSTGRIRICATEQDSLYTLRPCWLGRTV